MSISRLGLLLKPRIEDPECFRTLFLPIAGALLLVVLLEFDIVLISMDLLLLLLELSFDRLSTVGGEESRLSISYIRSCLFFSPIDLMILTKSSTKILTISIISSFTLFMNSLLANY